MPRGVSCWSWLTVEGLHKLEVEGTSGGGRERAEENWGFSPFGTGE